MGGSVGASGNGGASGSSPDAGGCPNGDARCSDNSCSKLLWSFDSGELGGIFWHTSSGAPLAVRSFNGNNALALDVAQINVLPEVSFNVPLCASGTVDLRTKTLTFRVYFDGTPNDFWLQSAVPGPPAYLDQISSTSNTWINYSSPLSKSNQSGSTKSVTIHTGTLGGAFTGTIWFDDIKIR